MPIEICGAGHMTYLYSEIADIWRKNIFGSRMAISGGFLH